MTQTVRARKALASRKRVRSAPLFATAQLPKQPRPAAQVVADRPHWFARWAGGLLRSFGSTLLRVRWGLRA
jgi:hypothetical protein